MKAVQDGPAYRIIDAARPDRTAVSGAVEAVIGAQISSRFEVGGERKYSGTVETKCPTLVYNGTSEEGRAF